MMKNILLFFVLFLSFHSTRSQALSQEKQFLTWFFTAGQNKNKKDFLYVSEQTKYTTDNLRETILKDTLKSTWGTTDRLVLTKREKDYLKKSIDKMESDISLNDIFPNAKIITQDTLDMYFKKYKPLGWEMLYNKNIHGFYSLNTPIFLRKGTVCIFQYGYYCGSLCGNGEIAVYVKDKTGWKYFFNLSNWVS